MLYGFQFCVQSHSQIFRFSLCRGKEKYFVRVQIYNFTCNAITNGQRNCFDSNPKSFLISTSSAVFSFIESIEWVESSKVKSSSDTVGLTQNGSLPFIYPGPGHATAHLFNFRSGIQDAKVK